MGSQGVQVAGSGGSQRAVDALIALIGVAVFLNYVDRGAIGVAAPRMMGDLALTASTFGFAVSAFFWVYAPLQIFAGWLADRVSVYRLMAWGLAIWALATLLTGFVTGFASLVALRLVLGLGECVAFPGGSKLIARHVPAAQRGFANAVLGAGLAFGPAAGTLAGGMILAAYGWRPIFVAFGAITLLWLVPWRFTVSGLHAGTPPTPEAPYPFRDLLRQKPLWLAVLGHFVANWGLYFTLTWLPLYLTKVRGLPIETMALMASATYATNGVTTLVSGRWSDAFIARHAHDEGLVRRRIMAASQAGFALGIAGIWFAGSPAALWFWLVFTGFAAGLTYPNLYGIAQIFAGPRASGSWIGLQNGVGNLAGIIGPALIGVTIDLSGGSYAAGFVLSAGLAAFAVVVWLWIVPPIRQVVEH